MVGLDGFLGRPPHGHDGGEARREVWHHQVSSGATSPGTGRRLPTLEFGHNSHGLGERPSLTTLSAPLPHLSPLTYQPLHVAPCFRMQAGV